MRLVILVKYVVLTIFLFVSQYVDAQFTQYGKTLEYHGRNSKTLYKSPVSISFQGCSPTNNDNNGNISLFFPTSKAGNVVSCTDIGISNPKYVVFNRKDFDIWTLGDRSIPVVLCEKSKIDNYITIYTKVQMDASKAKYEAKKKELQKSKEDNEELKRELKTLEIEHTKEINEIKSNALIFAYVDEEKLDSLQYEQHKCILNNDIEGAVRIGQQIDFKNNINKQLSNFELSIKKSQEIGLKLFKESEALYLHLRNCDMLSLNNDSIKENYELLIRTYRTLIEQYPTNFKCTESVYNKTKLKLGNIIYTYLDKFYSNVEKTGEDSLYIYNCMKESASYNNSKAIYWLAENSVNYEEAKSYAKLLFEGVKSGLLNSPEEWLSFYDIKDMCNSFFDFRIDNSSMVYYYTILDNDEVSLVHAYCKDSTLTKIVIPQKVVYNNREYTVTEIGACAFGSDSYGRYLNFGTRRVDDSEYNNNFDILSNRTTLGEAVVKLYFPKTLKYVGSAAFNPRLQPVRFKINEIPQGLEILRNRSFRGCTYKKDLVINDKVTIIEEQALPPYYDEKGEYEFAEEAYKCNYNITIPYTLKILDAFHGYSGGMHGDNSRVKIVSINDNPNFRMIDGSLYNADSSYVYLGTVGQYNNRLNITRNLRIDDAALERLYYLFINDVVIDSITIDERNPFYSYYEKCLYTKQLDTLLYILPSASRVRLSSNIKNIEAHYLHSYVLYELPDDISIDGIKAFLEEAIYGDFEFEYKRNKYHTNSINEDFISTFQHLNSQDSKALTALGLVCLEEDKYFQAYDLMKSIGSIEGESGEYYTLLKDSCNSYYIRMQELKKILYNTDSGKYDEIVDLCNRLKPYINSRVAKSTEESVILDAFYLNWISGVHESYRPRALEYMENAELYSQKLLELYNTVDNKTLCSNFYRAMAIIAWNEDQAKAILYIQKAIELLENDEMLFKQNNDAYRTNLAITLNEYAYFFACQKQYDKAMETIDKAIVLMPEGAYLYDSKGEILLMQGKNGEALVMWKKVLELNPDFLKDYPDGTELSNGLKKLGLIE